MTDFIHFRKIGDLTVRHVEGAPDQDQIADAIRKNYADPTSKICWIMLPGSSIRKLNLRQVKEITATARSYAEERPGGKTALVAAEHFEFAMGRVIETHSGLLNMPFDIRVFRTEAEAAEWLGVQAADLTE